MCAIQRTYTGINMFNDELCQVTNDFMDKFASAKAEHAHEMPSDTECMLHIDRDETDSFYECYYYLINHTSRVMFWLNEFTADDMLSEVDGVTDLSHIRKSGHGIRAVSHDN
jgi:hypothetical protein